MIIRSAEVDLWAPTDITSYPVPLIRGDTILADGKAVAIVHETHLCKTHAEMLAYIEAHPCS